MQEIADFEWWRSLYLAVFGLIICQSNDPLIEKSIAYQWGLNENNRCSAGRETYLKMLTQSADGPMFPWINLIVLLSPARTRLVFQRPHGLSFVYILRISPLFWCILARASIQVFLTQQRYLILPQLETGGLYLTNSGDYQSTDSGSTSQAREKMDHERAWH